jgi:sugar phosphate isomerase/epimerase
LIYLYYGEWKGDTILWWIFERLNEEGELLPIEITINLENQEESKTEEHLIENPEQLWDLLKKIENKSKF